MNATRLTWVVIALALISAAETPAQQTQADRKLFEDVKVKAEKGDAAAAAGLASFYIAGRGVPQDYAQAVKWLRKAAEGDVVLAQSFLGWCYESGKGTKQDYAEAVKWYRKAVEKGDAFGQFGLGHCYANGLGVPQDYAKAAQLHRDSAEQGFAEAQRSLAACYLAGKGVPQNDDEGIKWTRKAAEQDEGIAELFLATAYHDGRWGIPQDFVEAYKWANLSAAHGQTGAISLREVLRGEMTPEQVAEGQRLTREFKPRRANQYSVVSPESVTDVGPSASDTGFFITDDGYLISNYHVVKDAAQVRLVTSAGFISAKVVNVDAANDLALLKADGRFAPLPIAASRGVKLGGTVVTVGFPNIGLQGFSPKLAKGEIASLSGAADDARYFQISVPVQPGNSGGALVDERGNVIGIVSAKLDASAALAATGALPENVNYAVKSPAWRD
ncbi:MAG: tetratricopeptide repeat-containing serine protease family protein [Verrucomicrobiota bacterium]|jgi:hypothetical protein